MNKQLTDNRLDKQLGPWMLWGLGVGYVISGMYFGWNLGLAAGGTLGLGIATLFIMVMYVTLTFSYTELACAIPRAGGVFDYAKRSLGPSWGFMAGMTQNIEFIFAPPAIAMAIAAYLGQWFPELHLELIAVFAYLVFTAINVLGVKTAALLELVMTLIAVCELLLFAGITLPHFELQNLTVNSLPNGVSGIFAAIPFAIWFFLAIEGVANVAEETISPQRNILLGFSFALLTLVILCFLTFLSAVGVAGWEAAVFKPGSTVPSDSPLPLVLAQIVGRDSVMMHLLIGVGIFGLIASFHGIILAAGRATFEFGREGFAPAFLGKTLKSVKTPAPALLFNMCLGIIAILTGKTGNIITIACFGALGLYILSMVSLLQLRRKEPALERPFKVPFYPVFPLLALFIAVIAFLAMTWFNLMLSAIYFALMIGSLLGYKLFLSKNLPLALEKA